MSPDMIHSQSGSRVLHLIPHHHRTAVLLAKAKRILKWQRDPEGMRVRILAAAKQEFAAHGLAGARVDNGAGSTSLRSKCKEKDHEQAGIPRLVAVAQTAEG
jgi:hypothetical protein